MSREAKLERALAEVIMSSSVCYYNHFEVYRRNALELLPKDFQASFAAAEGCRGQDQRMSACFKVGEKYHP